MKKYSSYLEIEKPESGSVVTIGNFDGLHLGHQLLINYTVERSKILKVSPAVYTFSPHPASVLSGKALPRLMTDRDKENLFKKFGIKMSIFEKFDLNYARIEANAFLEEVLESALNAKEVVVGDNFRFGAKKEGDVSFMKKAFKKCGIKVTAVPSVKCNEAVCSSGKIRRFIENGDLVNANRFLGRPYSVTGQVVKGQSLGKSIGFPTVNLSGVEVMLPRNGVYLTVVYLYEESKIYLGATNVGVRPTLGKEKKTVVETHLLNFKRDIYGQKISIFFVEHMRGEEKFTSVNELKAQIHKDVNKIKKRSKELDLLSKCNSSDGLNIHFWA